MKAEIPVYIVTDPNAKAPPFSCGHIPECVECGSLLHGNERTRAYDDSMARRKIKEGGWGFHYPWDGPEQTCGKCKEGGDK